MELFEQLTSVYTLLITVAVILICLFQYVSETRRVWVLALTVFLADLMSNYYWSIYILVMHDYPNVSSFLAYFGWNVAFLMLPVMQYEARYPEEKGFVTLLAFLPVPVNAAQILLYVQYGGIFNNLWQGTLTTISACLAINSIVYYVKHRKEGARIPYVSAVVIFYILIEYIMWTSSCFDWPSEWANPYNYASLLEPLCYFLIPLALIRMNGTLAEQREKAPQSNLRRVFKPVYMIAVTIFCIGGYLLALWMRGTLASGIGEMGESDPYSVIAVMLFVISTVIVSFSMMIILVVGFEQKTEEIRTSREAKNLAERSNAAKSDFLAGMSHEIRTPINALLGMNEMVLRESLRARDDLPEERGEIRQIFSDICNYSGNIDSAGNSLLSIINDILDFSRIEAGKMELVNAEYKLSSVLNDVSNMIEFKASSKGLEFIVEVEQTVPDCLYGDELRIRQIVTNLLNNAVKYTNEGRVTLSVDLADRPADVQGGRSIDLIIGVRDTGIGIKKEDMDRLFGKFERMELDRNSTVEGTGLGLAITRNLVEMMGGTVDVKSIYGVGSSFTVTIPQRVIADEPIGDFREKFKRMIGSLKARKEAFRAPDAHILVVDDTKMNLVVAQGLLKNTEIRIDTAQSGQEAIALAARNRYDIILMDQRMPEMDGITAMRRIREDINGANAKTPFICLTADAVSGAREKYLAEGFDDYLSKPLDGSSLESALLRYLPEDRILREAETHEAPREAAEAASASSADTGATEAMHAGEMPEVHGEREAAEAAVASSVDTGAAETMPAGEMSDDSGEPEALLDKTVGLRYSGGSEELYRELLDGYTAESAEKASELNRSYEKRDWKNYAVVVHSLKSTSRMIGATPLSEAAACMEKAADAGDETTLLNGHARMMRMYDRVVRLLS